MQNNMPKKTNPTVLALLITGGIVIIACAVLLLMNMTRGSGILGPWHSEALVQQLRFHNDDTVVIQTQMGAVEGKYIFDAKSGKGIITMDGKGIEFTASGGSLQLMYDGVPTEFVRGEMNIQTVFADATPEPGSTPPPTDTPAPEPSPAPETSQAPRPTAATGATPAPVDTPKIKVTTPAPFKTTGPSATPKFVHIPTPSPTPAATFFKPGVSLAPVEPTKFPDIEYTGISIIGTWVQVGNSSKKLKFNDDDTFSMDHIYGDMVLTGHYMYDKSSGEGRLFVDGMNSTPFKVVSGKVVFQGTGILITYERQ